MSADDQSPKIYRPKPRRPFDNNLVPHQPPSPLFPQQDDETPSRTHSVLNLTSSTLFGIYSPTGYDRDTTEPSTPWGTGAETPYENEPIHLSLPRTISNNPPAPTPSTSSRVGSTAWRTILLFGMGMGYGILVRHLHDDRKLAAVQVEGIIKPRDDWTYLLFWGLAGVALGSLLPYIDTQFYRTASARSQAESHTKRRASTPVDNENSDSGGILGADWTPAIRSVGAFVGIAYAIVRLRIALPCPSS
jgi:hypothetical protein